MSTSQKRTNERMNERMNELMNQTAITLLPLPPQSSQPSLGHRPIADFAKGGCLSRRRSWICGRGTGQTEL